MATADQYAEWIVANQAKKGSPEFETVAAAYKQARSESAVLSAPTPTQTPAQPDESWLAREGRLILGIGGQADLRSSVIGRTMEGMARPAGGLAQLLTGGNQDVTNRVNEARKQAEANLPQGDTNVAGYVGEALSPTTMIPVAKIPMAASMVGKVAQGVGIGGVAGAVAPVANTENFAKQKIDQTLTGMAIGGIIPPALWAGGKLLSGAYNTAIEPWLNPASIKGRALIAAAGDKYDEVVALLKAQKQIVPGSRPTAGEAAAPAGATKFSALQESARGVMPDEYLARTDAGNAARLAAVRSVGGDESTLAAAKGTRAANASQNYGAVENQLVKSDSTLNELLSRPSMEKALTRAKTIAEDKGQTFDIGQNIPSHQVSSGVLDASGSPFMSTVPAEIKQFPVQSLHNIKLALDDMIRDPKTFGIGAEEARAIGDIRSKFVPWIENKAPGYGSARAAYAADSMPVNQQQIGQYIEGKLIPSLDDLGRQKPEIYSKALEDAPGTIKRATDGSSRFDTLAKSFSDKPEDLAKLYAVKDDLARLQRHGTMATLGSKSAPSAIDLATQSMERQVGGKIPNLLNRTAMIANAIVMRLEGKINRKLAAELAAEMLDPSGVAASMAKEKAHQLRNANIADVVSRLITRPAMAGTIETSQNTPLKE